MNTDYIKEALVLNEMAYERDEAINRCASLGKQFISHFHTVMRNGKDSNDFIHHCEEMQARFDDVKFIVLKYNKKIISSDNLINWFFTVGSSVEYQIEEPYQQAYEDLYISLLSDRVNSSVIDIMMRILGG